MICQVSLIDFRHNVLPTMPTSLLALYYHKYLVELSVLDNLRPIQLEREEIIYTIRNSYLATTNFEPHLQQCFFNLTTQLVIVLIFTPSEVIRVLTHLLNFIDDVDILPGIQYNHSWPKLSQKSDNIYEIDGHRFCKFNSSMLHAPWSQWLLKYTCLGINDKIKWQKGWPRSPQPVLFSTWWCLFIYLFC